MSGYCFDIEVLKTDMFYEKSAKKCHENYIIIVTKQCTDGRKLPKQRTHFQLFGFTL